MEIHLNKVSAPGCNCFDQLRATAGLEMQNALGVFLQYLVCSFVGSHLQTDGGVVHGGLDVSFGVI